MENVHEQLYNSFIENEYFDGIRELKTGQNCKLFYVEYSTVSIYNLSELSFLTHYLYILHCYYRVFIWKYFQLQ
jgi:hypothetical protein